MRDHAHTLSDFRVPTLWSSASLAAGAAATASQSSWKSTATPSSPSCGIFSRTARRRDRRASTIDAGSGTARTAGSH